MLTFTEDTTSVQIDCDHCGRAISKSQKYLLISGHGHMSGADPSNEWRYSIHKDCKHIVESTKRLDRASRDLSKPLK